MAPSPTPERELPRALQPLADQVEKDGGRFLAGYREPVAGKWHLFVLLPMEKVSPTPFQRDLSPAHQKRLADVLERLQRFVDPIVVVSPEPGVYWTPNGNHRRSALESRGGKYIPAILIPEVQVAFQILALNTEKAHNLKEKALEVARMYKALLEQDGSRRENEFAFELEQAHFITLGFVYEERARFPGSAFTPILRRVDRFLRSSLRNAYPQRLERAAMVLQAEEILSEKVTEIQSRGVKPVSYTHLRAHETALC
ncbi:MAG: chromosome partitioning protein ParB, partial [Candidatus Eisenbacteria bacterium]|nr:chromosome partitioning protein ParB [Candidatus Eisenbacteria bacterium]